MKAKAKPVASAWRMKAKAKPVASAWRMKAKAKPVGSTRPSGSPRCLSSCLLTAAWSKTTSPAWATATAAVTWAGTSPSTGKHQAERLNQAGSQVPRRPQRQRQRQRQPRQQQHQRPQQQRLPQHQHQPLPWAGPSATPSATCRFPQAPFWTAQIAPQPKQRLRRLLLQPLRPWAFNRRPSALARLLQCPNHSLGSSRAGMRTVGWSEIFRAADMLMAASPTQMKSGQSCWRRFRLLRINPAHRLMGRSKTRSTMRLAEMS